MSLAKMGVTMMRGAARRIVLAGALLGAAGLLMADQPIKVFELDGNSVTGDTCVGNGTSPGGCDDWNLLNGDGTTGPPFGAAGNSLARSFISEPKGVDVFTTGGSKDPNPISQWQWKNGATPDKDTITNGYAAAYNDLSGHLILIFGADRFAQNGDSNIGLWFFQENVAPVGTTGGGFSGAHEDNDILIVSAFTGGGGVSTISVYLWDHTCAKGVNNPTPGQCADSNLRLKFASMPSSTCVGIDEGCAIVNASTITVSWPYLAKFGIGNTMIPAGGFFEGGLDITELLSTTALPCFTSFLLDTRTSQSTSATLKDFVAGSFNICGLNITKKCDGAGTLNAGEGTLHYSFSGCVTNIGIGSLDHVTIIDSLPSGATGVAFVKGSPTAPGPGVTCDSLAAPSNSVSTGSCPSDAPAGAVCADVGTLAGGGTLLKWNVQFDVTSLSPSNTAYAAGAFPGNTTGACSSSTTVCSQPPNPSDSCSGSVTNMVTISKACGVAVGYPTPGNANTPVVTAIPGTELAAGASNVGVVAYFSGDVCNTGDTTLTGVTVDDVPDGGTATTTGITIKWPGTAGTLAPSGAIGDCAKFSGTYTPTKIASGFSADGTTGGRYGFTDEIYVTGATATLGDSPPAKTACTSLTNAPTGAQACNGVTCNICPGTPSGLCSGN